jgi:hypothetical protein
MRWTWRQQTWPNADLTPHEWLGSLLPRQKTASKRWLSRSRSVSVRNLILVPLLHIEQLMISRGMGMGMEDNYWFKNINERAGLRAGGSRLLPYLSLPYPPP